MHSMDFSLSCDTLSAAAVPAVEVSDHFLQFPVLLKQWMCVHTARGGRRKGVYVAFLGFCEAFSFRRAERHVFSWKEHWLSTNTSPVLVCYGLSV